MIQSRLINKFYHLRIKEEWRKLEREGGWGESLVTIFPQKRGGGIYQRGSLIRRFTVCKSSRLTQPVLTKFFQSATIISKRFDSCRWCWPFACKDMICVKTSFCDWLRNIGPLSQSIGMTSETELGSNLISRSSIPFPFANFPEKQMPNCRSFILFYFYFTSFPCYWTMDIK